MPDVRVRLKAYILPFLDWSISIVFPRTQYYETDAVYKMTALQWDCRALLKLKILFKVGRL